MVDTSRMQYNHLGRSGILVSALSFGNWITQHSAEADEQAYTCFSRAIELGINFLDTAEVYGLGQAETHLGNVLKRGGWAREDLVISTKFMKSSNNPNGKGLSRKRLLQGMRNSLKRLQLDYADIIFCHRPDRDTPLKETLWSINHLIEKGKTDYWGLSEYSVTEIMEIYRLCDKYGYPYPIAEQTKYNMLARDRVETDLAFYYDKFGLGTTVWSPLAGGLFTGKYNDGNIPEGSRFSDTSMFSDSIKKYFGPDTKDETVRLLQSIQGVADELGCTQAQLALAWVIKNKDVSTAIGGATRPAQIEDNVGAIEVLPRLSAEVLNRIDDILGNKPAPIDNIRQNPYADPKSYRAISTLPARR